MAKGARKNSGQTEKPTAADGEILPGKNGGWLKPWKKGESGNPQGWTPGQLSAYHQARMICADASPYAARRQVEMLDDPDPRIVLVAAEAVLNRGVGKPREHPEDRGAIIDLDALTSDDRAALAALLRKAFGR